jgi:gluconolactonase
VPDKLTIYDNDGAAFSRLEAEKISSGYQFTEGPVWHPDGFLLFSDTPANKIYQLVPGKAATVYIDDSGFTGTDDSLLSDQQGSNGLALDNENHLIICQHGNHAIARLDKNKKINLLTTTYEGKPYNSPNDLVISADGSIYFSDPPYGLKEQVLHRSEFQPHAGLYRYYKGEVKLLRSDLLYPNGVCLSPDEQFLYNSSNHPDERVIWRYSLSKDGEIRNQSMLIDQNADGIKTDEEGRLFLATDAGVLIVSVSGKKLALMPLPETPSNVAWGGQNNKELYVTARTSVYRIKNFNQ